MARKSTRRRWNRNNRNVRVSNDAATGTPADEVAVAAAFTVVSQSDYRAISARLVWARRGQTGGEGPITVGLSHGDYTNTEIEEAIEATGAIDRGDKVAEEKANRLVRVVGEFPGQDADEVLNDGRPITTRLNWLISEGEVMKAWIYNHSGATLTTGSFLVVSGTLFIRFT